MATEGAAFQVVDPTFAEERAERGRPHLRTFDAAGVA
jgi:hypothetical protein